MPSSMEEIYKAHSQAVYRYLLSLTHSEELAEELTQETFYQAIKGIERFDGSCKITTWLCSIAKNQLYSYYRKHPGTETLEEGTQSNSSLEAEVMSNINRLEILKKLHLFQEPFREVMYLRLFGDLSFHEIGEVLGRTENWARVTYYRGKEKLKKEMDTDGK